MITWGNAWGKSWGGAWGPIANDQARSGWFRLWLIGLQEAVDKKPEEIKTPEPVFTKVVEQKDGSAVVGEARKRTIKKVVRRRSKNVRNTDIAPVVLPRFEPAATTFFEEVREFITDLNFPRIEINFRNLQDKVKSQIAKHRENDDIQALLLLV